MDISAPVLVMTKVAVPPVAVQAPVEDKTGGGGGGGTHRLISATVVKFASFGLDNV